MTVAWGEPGAKIWDVDSGNLVAELPLTKERVYGAEYTPDGGNLIGTTATQDGLLWSDWTHHVWDSKTGKSLRQVSADNIGFNWMFNWSDDGEKYASALSFNDIRIYSARTDQQLAKLKTNGRDQYSGVGSSGIVFTPDGQKVVVYSGVEGARLWDATTGNLISTLAGEVHYSEGAEFSPDGSLIASCRYGAYMWDAKSGKLVATFDKDCREIEFSADNSLIATSSDSGTVKVWYVQKQ